MGYVLVEPTSLTFAAGETKRYTVTFTSNAAAEFGEATAGALTWSNGTTNVRSPIVVKPVAIAAPGEVSGNSTPRSYDIVFGFAGPFAVAERGLVPAAKQSDSVADDPTNTFVVGGPGVKAHTVTVPAGVKLAGFSLFNEEITPAGSHDLDLYVYKGDTEVGVSAGSTSNGAWISPIRRRVTTRSTSTAGRPPAAGRRTTRCSAGSSARSTRGT